MGKLTVTAVQIIQGRSNYSEIIQGRRIVQGRSKNQNCSG